MDQNNLPKVNEYENGETDAINKLKLRLPVRLFEIREESVRDKGVDLIIELKHNDRYTNFRFVIQLKATATTDLNRDQSISYPVKVSNINYLMNYPMPAYYVLYEANSASFYFESCTKVYENLQQQYQPDNLPESYSVRFTEPFNEQAIESIHQENYNRGLLLGKAKPLIQFNIENKKLTGGVIIDENAQVYSETEIVAYLEKYGIALVNTGRDRKVIELLKRCRQQITSPLIHFICGTAYYHLSQLIEALAHFKKAESHKNELPLDIQGLLQYFIQIARFTVGMASKEDFQSTINQLLSSNYLGLFLRVEQNYHDFFDGNENTTEKIKHFYDEMAAIKSDPEADDNIQIIADAQALVLESDLLNDELHRTLSMMRMLPGGQFLLSEDLKRWYGAVTDLHQRTEKLKNFAWQNKNTHAYYIICLNSIRSQYRSFVTSKYIQNFDEDKLYVDNVLDKDEIAIVDEQTRFLTQIAKASEHLESFESVVPMLSLNYELLKFKGDEEGAADTAAKMLEIIDAYELNAFRPKLQRLTEGGTTHELFLETLKQRFEQSKIDTAEFHRLKEGIEEFDRKEKTIVKTTAAKSYYLQVFPLGDFRIPQTEWEKALTILHITDDSLKAHFTDMAGMVMPIVNVYNDPITQEGPANGNADFKGLSSIRNAYRIREAFFQNQFYHSR